MYIQECQVTRGILLLVLLNKNIKNIVSKDFI